MFTVVVIYLTHEGQCVRGTKCDLGFFNVFPIFLCILTFLKRVCKLKPGLGLFCLVDKSLMSYLRLGNFMYDIKLNSCNNMTIFRCKNTMGVMKQLIDALVVIVVKKNRFQH